MLRNTAGRGVDEALDIAGCHARCHHPVVANLERSSGEGHLDIYMLLALVWTLVAFFNKRYALMWLALALAVGLARFWRLGLWSLWYDEGLTLADAYHSDLGYNALGYHLIRMTAEAFGSPPTEFSLRPVSDRVNRAQTDDAACIEPVPEAPRQEPLF